MMSDIVSNQTFKIALDHIMGRKVSKGYDGMKTTDLPEYLAKNQDKLRESLLKGTYEPGYVQQYEIVGKNGKTRIISNPNAVDKFVARCILIHLTDIAAEHMCKESYAFQQGKSVIDAVKQCRDYVSEGYTHCIHIDFEDYFGSINHEILKRILQEVVKDRKATALILKLVECSVILDHQLIPWKHGIIQGSPLSPILSNLYLTKLDNYLKECHLPFVRFADDIYIFVNNLDAAYMILSELQTWIYDVLKLTFNHKKTGVYEAMSMKYLNSVLYRNTDGSLVIKKKNRSSKVYYREFTPQALAVTNGQYHILEDGILGKQDMTIIFENENMKQYFPVEMTEEINVYANLVYSKTLFTFLNEKRITLNMFDEHGQPIGCFLPATANPNASLLLKQVSVYNESKQRTELARVFEITAMRNIVAVIRYYSRRESKSHLDRMVEELQSVIQKMKKAKDVDQLFVLEAQARQSYYSCFPYIIENPDFCWKKRTKQPPEDPINAMISFGNTVLYNRISSIICRTRLDNRISYVHSAQRRSGNLCLDLADMYKPLIVDRTVFMLINKRRIQNDVHFVRETNSKSVLMSRNGVQIMIEALEKKFASRIQHFGQSKTYMSLIREDVHSLCASLEKDIVFKPYTEVK